MNDIKRQSIHRLQEDNQQQHQQQHQKECQYYQENYQQQHHHQQQQQQFHQGTNQSTAPDQTGGDFDVYRLLKGHDFRYVSILTHLSPAKVTKSPKGFRNLTSHFKYSRNFILYNLFY